MTTVAGASLLLLLAARGPVARAQAPAMPLPGGLLRVPADDVLPHRGLAIAGGGNYDPSGAAPPGTAEPSVSLREGFFDRIEAGVSGIGTRPDAGLGGMALRVCLFRESGPLPALTAGGLDLSGEHRGTGPTARVDWRDWRHHLDHLGVYAVAGKDLWGLGRAQVGVGDSHYLGRMDVGHAGAGAFGGVEISLRGSASAVAEYDGAHVNAGLRMTVATPPVGGSRVVLRALLGGADLLDRAPRTPALAFRIDLELRPVPAGPSPVFLPGSARRKARLRSEAATRPRAARITSPAAEPSGGEAATSGTVPRPAEAGTESSRIQVQIDTVQSHLDLIRGSGFGPLVDDLLKGSADNLAAARTRLAAGDLDGARRATELGGEQARLARKKIEEETQQPMRW